MFFDRNRSIAFVHVPKNGGTGIRTTLGERLAFAWDEMREDLGVDDLDRRVGDHDFGFPHPRLGRVKLDHLPLATLREHFPATFARFAKAQAFAIVREPRGRFISAVQQRLIEFEGLSEFDITPARLTAAARQAAEWLDGHPIDDDWTYVHLAPQSAFLCLDGAVAVGTLLELGDDAGIAAFLASAFGHDAGSGPERKSERIRYAAAGPVAAALRAVRPWTGRVFTEAQRQDLKRRLAGIGLLKRKQSSYAGLDLGRDTEAFIERFYADDARLLAAARERKVSP